MDREELFLGYHTKQLWITVHGHATARYCRELRDRVRSLLEELGRDEGADGILVDLSRCSYMDSTFLGLLVTLNRRYCIPRGTKLGIYKPTTQCSQLIAEIGLNELVAIHWKDRESPANSVRLKVEHEVNAGLILKAHEELMGLSEENRRRFAQIHGLLKREAG